jgi:glycosyltransferase involved in cell wall biosynthesis
MKPRRLVRPRTKRSGLFMLFNRRVVISLQLLFLKILVYVLIIAFFLISGVQCVYLSVFLYQFLRVKTQLPIAPPQPVSIIVCAHDEEQNLRELLPLLVRQDYREYEIIVVEDRCNDGTFDFLTEVSVQHPTVRIVRVRHVPEHVNGKKFGLTLGIRAAKYDWVLLTDADCRPATVSWIRVMSENFTEDTEIVIGFSAYQKSDGLLNSFIRFETILTGIQYIGLAWAGMPYMGVGRNLAYRKSLFLDNKGFNNQLNITGGDDDLFVNEHATARNTRVAIGEDVLVKSSPKKTVVEFYYQKIRHLSVGKSYKFFTRFILGFFTGTWILLWLTIVPVCIFSPWTYEVLGIISIRWILLSSLVQSASRSLGDAFQGWKAPFLEFIYAFYYLVAGTVALVSKKVRWKI